MITDEQIRIIAEYDGFTFRYYRRKYYVVDIPENRLYWASVKPDVSKIKLSDLMYYASMDWLHPVAIRLHEEMQEYCDNQKISEDEYVDAYAIFSRIKDYIWLPIMQGGLVEALYDAILYLRAIRNQKRTIND